MSKMVWYSPANSIYSAAVAVDRVTHLTRHQRNNNLTVIHLDTGETLVTEEDIDAVVGKINESK